MKPQTVTPTPVYPTDPIMVPHFTGLFRNLWAFLYASREHSRRLKILAAQTQLVAAEAAKVTADADADIAYANAQVAAIRDSCAAGVHIVPQWQTGRAYEVVNRLNNAVTGEYVVLHGFCKYCNSPVDKRHYTMPES